MCHHKERSAGWTSGCSKMTELINEAMARGRHSADMNEWESWEELVECRKKFKLSWTILSSTAFKMLGLSKTENNSSNPLGRAQNIQVVKATKLLITDLLIRSKCKNRQCSRHTSDIFGLEKVTKFLSRPIYMLTTSFSMPLPSLLSSGSAIYSRYKRAGTESNVLSFHRSKF